MEIQNLYNREMGFSLVVKALIDSKKPIIGHNMIYDIIYLLNQFVMPLPADYAEFVKEVMTFFT